MIDESSTRQSYVLNLEFTKPKKVNFNQITFNIISRLSPHPSFIYSPVTEVQLFCCRFNDGHENKLE